MKLYNFYFQKNINYYFIIVYTQINFRIFKSFNVLLKNFLKNYKYLTWFDSSYKSHVKINTRPFNLLSNFNILSFKIIYELKFNYKYTKYLETSLLNFNLNRSVFNELKKKILHKKIYMVSIFLNTTHYLCFLIL